MIVSNRKYLVGLFYCLILSFFVLETHIHAAELSYEIVAKGSGDIAKRGMRVAVHYQGRFTDGTIFDDSKKRGEPISFVLGNGQVIAGWERGIEGMQVGEKRVLTIPPELSYGEAGVESVIPPAATLVFDVELVSISVPAVLGEASNSDLKVAKERGVIIIDIRRPEEWASTGIIAGSHTITAFKKNGQLHPDFQSKFTSLVTSKNTPVLLYCRTGNRTGVIGNALVRQLSYSQVTHLKDGIVGWKKDGEPTSPYKK